MEFVDGETLRRRSTGKERVEVLLKQLLQVAEGFGQSTRVRNRASRSQTRHIVVTRDGHAKVLISVWPSWLRRAARSRQSEGGEAPTRSCTTLRAGMIMGTVGYMSPNKRKRNLWTSAPTSSLSAAPVRSSHRSQAVRRRLHR